MIATCTGLRCSDMQRSCTSSQYASGRLGHQQYAVVESCVISLASCSLFLQSQRRHGLFHLHSTSWLAPDRLSRVSTLDRRITAQLAQCAATHLLEGEEHADVPGAQARKVGDEAAVEGLQAVVLKRLDEAVDDAVVHALRVACRGNAYVVFDTSERHMTADEQQSRGAHHDAHVSGRGPRGRSFRRGQLRACTCRRDVAFGRPRTHMLCPDKVPHADHRQALQRDVLCMCVAGSAPMSRDLTTSTGLPQMTAKKPAPRPDRMWQYTLSSTMPDFNSVSFTCAAWRGTFRRASTGRSHCSLIRRNSAAL